MAIMISALDIEPNAIANFMSERKLEAVLQNGDCDKIEFRFARFGGTAKGRFAIIVFAWLFALALFATMILWWRITSVGIAYYDHLDSPQSRAMTKPFHTPLEGGSNARRAFGEGYAVVSQDQHTRQPNPGPRR